MESKGSKVSATLASNPSRRAGMLSKLLFLWLFPLLKKGYRRTLESLDLYAVLEEDESKQLGDKLEGYWQFEVEQASTLGRQPSLQRALIKMSWRTLVIVTIFSMATECVFIVAQPIFLRYFILMFEDKTSEWWKAYAYAGAICVISFLHTLTTQPALYLLIHMSMKLRVAVSSLIYRKSLRLSRAAQRETNCGQIVNLLANDCSQFDTSFTFLPYVAIAPIQVPILTYLLYQQIGSACFAGVGYVVILLPIQYLLGKYTAVFRLQIAQKTDERGRHMREIIAGMRIIKQYAWEKPFSDMINRIRKMEIAKVRQKGLLRGLHHAIFRFSGKLVPYITFLVLFLTGEEQMTADKVFFTMACFHTIIQTTLQFVPHAVIGVGEYMVAVKRIQTFLLLDEHKGANNVQLYKSFVNCIKMETDFRRISCETGLMEGGNNNNDKIAITCTKRIQLKNVCAKWTQDSKPTLDDITFSVECDNMLVMVVGPVGSSKTSLLNAIIEELPISSGSLAVSGNVSYAAQEPWIFAGNLRQNILFGLPYEEDRYKQTLKACALEQDLKQLPYGDMTIVGERGVALSGGQKARVNLARAIYRQADIYLLDDPLSAVDTRVGRHLFENCVKEHLSGSVRILVTHQLEYLEQADYLLVMGDGKIVAQGTFEELKCTGVDFIGRTKSEPVEKVESDAQSVTLKTLKMEESSKLGLEMDKPRPNIERKDVGCVTARTYWQYFMSGHSLCDLAFLILILISCQLFTSGADYWLSYWTKTRKNCASLEINNMTIIPNSSPDNSCDSAFINEHAYLYVYTAIVGLIVILNLFRGFGFYIYCAKASATIHKNMFHSIIRAPLKFFDDNCSGRIMNRFTKDIGSIDERLATSFLATITTFLQILAVVCVVIISNYYLIVVILILIVSCWWVKRIFIGTQRDVKRIESIARSPLFAHVSASMDGLTTIRACKCENILTRQFEEFQDMHSSAWFLFVAANRCFGIWLELLSNLFLVLVTFSFLFISSQAEQGNVGLVISSLLSVMGTLQWGMRQSAETENYMTSAERAFEYSELTPEADLESKSESKPSLGWPHLGKIEYRNVFLTYDPNVKPVLKGISFKIRPSEKIGIVGRTGAGKSSLISALFRLTEPEGEILIDNVAVKRIGLHDLRKTISIIPQDPVLFSGSVRYNLDPFNQFDDHHLWKVIEQVELRDAVSSLDYLVADGGTNFSVGQRQLVCLARAILRQNKILVMDEATANVDPKTDQLIQQTIRSKFSDCTIITIAHRLHTIIDCDRILVLDNGQVKEYDHPHVLLQNNEGIFTGMVAQTGQTTEAMLRRLAREALTKPSIH